jgi:peptidoglycan/xylan/chitin deacetylase (PgdA/CDA1 family)
MARRSVHLAVKGASMLYDRARPPGDGVVILAYHRVGGGSTLELDLDPAVFDAQMAELAATGRVVALDQAADLLSGAAPRPEDGPPVAITFDDGTADFVDHALPSLVEHALPATYYIATRFVDEQIPFPDRGAPLTWTAIREAASTGLVTFGSHTHSHAVMDKLGQDDADQELSRSAERLADELEAEARHFAYPKGVFGGAGTERRVARLYATAALADGGMNLYGDSDPLRLDRIPIQRSDGMRFFRHKAGGGLRLEGQARKALNTHRYRSTQH